MRIGINLLYLLPGVVGGTETYAAGLLYGLAAEKDKRDEFFVFVNKECENWPIPASSNFVRVVCPVQAISRSKRYLYEQMQLPRLLDQYKIDVVHSLGYVAPLYPPCRSVLTIPDVNYVVLKQTLPFFKRLMASFFSRYAAKKCDHIITISNFSKSEIIRYLKIEPKKITVTHLSYRKGRYNENCNEWGALEEKYGIKKPYIAAFGGGSLHKNIPTLIQAYDLVKDKINHNLLLIGHLPLNVNLSSDKISKELMSRIFTTGYVPEEHILPLLKNADLYILPSLYEGFGLPVLEAQQAGVPVLCSNAGSIPEIGGQGALYFDPKKTHELAALILNTLRDSDQRAQLVNKGTENLAKYSWENTARETMQVYYNNSFFGNR